MDFAAIEPELKVAIIAAAATLIAAALTASWTAVRNRKDRLRDLYGSAYEVAMAWREMVYRIRRRGPGDDQDRLLVDRFHELQERIDYYQGWIGSESVSMCRSYEGLVREVKQETKSMIQAAWSEPGRALPSGALPSDEDPKVQVASSRFLKDVRLHLSGVNVIIFIPRIWVWFRNRKTSTVAQRKEAGSGKVG